MAEQGDNKPQVPQSDNKPHVPEVTYANLVTVNITNDDVLFEFWENRVGFSTPPLKTWEEITKVKGPLVRVVVPFASVRWLNNYLDGALATAGEKRKAGE